VPPGESSFPAQNSIGGAWGPDKPTISSVSKTARRSFLITLGGFENPSHHQRVFDRPPIVVPPPPDLPAGTLWRGQQRFTINCTPCHGATGEGKGITQKIGAMAVVANLHDKRIVELVEFETGDPAFAGEMIITTTLGPVSGGTEVTFAASNVPLGIRPEDHHKGMMSTLENLADFTRNV